MSYSSTKANGNIRFYSEKHLQDLDYEGLFAEQQLSNAHYGYVTKNIHVFSGESLYFFAKRPEGYVYLGSGQCEPETLGIQRVHSKYETSMFYVHFAKRLIADANDVLQVENADTAFIKDIVDYLTEFYDIFQMVMADEESQGREASDSEPNFDMSKYIQTKSGNALSANALPYTITLPYHDKKITITKELVAIEALE